MKLKTTSTSLWSTQRMHPPGFGIVFTAENTIIRTVLTTMTAPEDEMRLSFASGYVRGNFPNEIRRHSVETEDMNVASMTHISDDSDPSIYRVSSY